MDKVKLRNLNHAVYLLVSEQDLQINVAYSTSHSKALGKWITVWVEVGEDWYNWIANDDKELDQITSMLLCLFNSLTWGREE
jgi:hypothetical protein